MPKRKDLHGQVIVRRILASLHRPAGLFAVCAASLCCTGDDVEPSTTDPDLLAVTRGLRIGGEHAVEYSLQEIFDAAETSNGELFVAQWRVPQVSVFDAGTGHHLRYIGRAGAGPGAFGQPSKLGFTGDTLWVMDSEHATIQLYDRDGAYLDGIRFSRADPSGTGLLWPRVLLDATHVWVEREVGTTDLQGPGAVEVPIFAANRLGEVLARLGTRRFKHAYFALEMEGGGFTSTPNPFLQRYELSRN